MFLREPSKREFFLRNLKNNLLTLLIDPFIPSRLEPPGLSRVDGKRPDGVSIIPWSSGKPLVWDATCIDTYAPSYQSLAAHAPGVVAARAESQKLEKYANLSHSHFFTPIAIETTGVLGPKTFSFIKDLARRITRQSGDPKSTTYLFQRLSMAVQLGNAVSIMGSWQSHFPAAL